MTIPSGQAGTAALLARLTGGAAPVETHVSAVFVGPDRALKLKKAVRLDFLDFTPLAAREHFCRRELALNLPAAPGLYREVLPVTRAPDGGLALGGTGEAVDWVLHMAPIPPGDFLDRIAAAEGGLPPALLDQLADAVAAHHASLPPIPGVDAPAALGAIIEGNLRAAADAGLPAEPVAEWAGAARAALARLAPALAARAAGGRIRRCHGDLHLGNLCLWLGRPTLFDALEFDEALATIDTGYDLAFLLMDLDRRAGRPAANRVMNRLLARCGDTGMLAPLPLWLSVRAMVRAHVEAARARDGLPYLAAARDYLRPVPARILAVGGLPGSGKSRLARAIAPRLGAAPGALVLRSDEIRKRRHGVAPEQRLPGSAYAEAESLAVHAELFAAAEAAARAGHAVVADAAFLDPAHRAGIAAAAARAGVPFTGLWLEAPLALLRARIAARRGDASDATEAVLEHAAQAPLGDIDWLRLDAATDPIPGALAMLAPALTPSC